MNAPKLFHYLLALAAVAAPLATPAQPLGVEVAAIRGSASTVATGSSSRLTSGTSLPAGTTIQTGARSAVDLFLGNTAGTLRLTQNSTLTIVKFDVRADDANEIEFHLTAGSAIGIGNRVKQSKPYLIKVPSGILDTHAKKFRINANGLIVGIEGPLVFAHMPKEASPQLHHITAPPPSYFWPDEGVKPAPPALVREVTGQINARIQSR